MAAVAALEYIKLTKKIASITHNTCIASTQQILAQIRSDWPVGQVPIMRLHASSMNSRGSLNAREEQPIPSWTCTPTGSSSPASAPAFLLSTTIPLMSRRPCRPPPWAHRPRAPPSLDHSIPIIFITQYKQSFCQSKITQWKLNEMTHGLDSRALLAYQRPMPTVHQQRLLPDTCSSCAAAV